MSNRISKVKQKCLDKWKYKKDTDERLEFFFDHFEDWINQIDRQYHPCVLDLIEFSNYYTNRFSIGSLELLHGELKREEKFDPKTTLYTYIISKDGATNSSNVFWSHYQYVNNDEQTIVPKNCITDLGSDEISWNKIKSIVFIDDFSGSGDSLRTILEKYKDKLKNKKIYFITIHIMEEAVQNLKEFCKKNQMEFTNITINTTDKILNNSKMNVYKDDIISLSGELGLIDKGNDTLLGWKDSQSLVFFANNTPNNTIMFLRYEHETSEYFSIFPRNNKKSKKRPDTSEIKKRISEQKRINYINSF